MSPGVGGEKECQGYAARDKSGHLAPFEFKRRAPGPKDVSLRISCCGVCHSDLHQIRGEWGGEIYPMVPGHEIVGIVEEVGSIVTRFKPGDRVGVGCMVDSCRKCDACKNKVEQYCLKGAVFTYNSKAHDGKNTYGGYSNYMVITEDFALHVPENLPLDAAAPLLCAGITVYSPMKYYQMESGGKNFGVVGLGGLGHIAAKIAKAMGMHVTVISTSPSKEQEAKKVLGADNFIFSKDEKQMEAAKATLDFIIDTVSVLHPVDPYLDLLRTNGKLILVGLSPGQMQFIPIPVVLGRKTIGGSLIGGVEETQEMLDFCGKHNIVSEIEKIPIDYINTAMERLEKGHVQNRFVIDCENSFNP
uniref:Cinnamyl alcohol dehydrogenase CAD1 n=1 Tax=Conocephalum conicum TaxID=41839 RepID=A0AAU2B500_CONCI